MSHDADSVRARRWSPKRSEELESTVVTRERHLCTPSPNLLNLDSIRDFA